MRISLSLIVLAACGPAPDARAPATPVAAAPTRLVVTAASTNGTRCPRRRSTSRCCCSRPSSTRRGLSEAYARMFVRLGTIDRQWIVIPKGDHAALLEDTAPRLIAAIRAFIERP